MGQKKQFVWVSATAVCLAAFSYFAGLGVRGVIDGVSHSTASASAMSGFPRLASLAPRVPDPDTRPQQLYFDVLSKLRLYYVEQLPDNTRLAYGSVARMLDELNDPNTRLLSPLEVTAMRDEMQGQFNGLGAVLTIQAVNPENDRPAAAGTKKTPLPGVKTVTVVTVAPGSAAEKAGLQPGDRITEIDGHWIAPEHVSFRQLTMYSEPPGPQDLTPHSEDEEPANPEKKLDPERERLKKAIEEQARRWKGSTDLPTALQGLYGELQGEHEVTVERGAPTKTVKLKVQFGKSQTPVFSARKLHDNTGYLQFFVLSPETAQQAQQALAGFKKDGVQNVVVDLRRCAGGTLEAARDIAGSLMGDGKFAVLKVRDDARKLVDQPVMVKGASQPLKPAAVSVLVDGGTAGTAELLAGALHDNVGAKLVGSTTFGDGTEQEIVRLDNGAGVSITRAKMLTAKGTDYDGKGLKADLPAQGDPVEAAVKALASRGTNSNLTASAR